MKEGSTKFNKRMSQEDKDKILEMYQNGKTNIEISKVIKCSNTAVRTFLKKNGLTSNKITKRDRSRPCKICGIVFVPKYDDGIKKEKYTNCSIKCGRIAISESKIKYTQQDIDKVIELKKNLFTNGDIVIMTKVNINKVKEIVKDNELYLTSEQAQQNAYNKKLEKNPNAMKEMRDVRDPADPEYQINWQRENRDKTKKYREDYKKKNPEKVKQTARDYNKKYPAVRAFHSAKRRAAKLQATPPWLTEEHWGQIRSLYEACPKCFHVDHIVPLQGKTVSGLHVPWNLQIIPAEDNLRKSNRI